MVDTIRGPVTRIIDGDTFEMKVASIGTDNQRTYNDKETIRIADIDAPELRTAAGKRSKDMLEKKLLSKEVRCYIQARDTYGRLVAEVKMLA